MPLVDSFNGIKIFVYYGDHMPPHIHVFYNEYHAIFAIESGTLIRGSIPAKQKRLVNKWLNNYADNVIEIFYSLNPKNYEKKNPNTKNSED